MVHCGCCGCYGGCVAPFYGTARIEQGFHADAGAAGMIYSSPYSAEVVPQLGLLADACLRYGFSPTVSAGCRMGLGFGQSEWGVIYLYENSMNPRRLFPDAALNLQLTYPGKTVASGVLVEGSFSHGISLAVLAGLGDPEKLTFGVRCSAGGSYVDAGLDLFMIMRPEPLVSIFVGVDPLASAVRGDRFVPVATLGVGYKLK